MSADDSDAVAALQGVRTAPIIDSTDIAVTARAIRAIRVSIRDVRDIRGLPIDHEIDLALSEHGGRRVMAGLGRSAGRVGDTSDQVYPITRTGLRSVDSANAVYSVSSIEVHCCISGVYLIERFARPVNVRILAEQYLGVPDVESPSAGFYSGALSRITLVRKGTLLDFVFDRRGPACGAEESSHRYFVTYDRRDGQVTWHGEQCIPGFDYGG